MKTIVLTFDKNYGPAACTTLTSVFINNPYTDFEVDIIYTSTYAELERALDTLATLFHRTINRHLVGESFLDQFDISDHFTKATYLRLLIPDLIDKDLILYLDCDLIVQTNVAELFDVAIGQKLVGVIDLAGITTANLAMQLEANEPYINAGVIAFDNRIWRTENISEQIIGYFKKNREKITWYDQCAINGALAGNKTLANWKFNVLYQDIELNNLKHFDFDASSFDGIFHYNSKVKPWHLWCKNPYKSLWDKYASISPLSPEVLVTPRDIHEWHLLAQTHETNNNFKDAAAIYKKLFKFLSKGPN